MIHCTLEYALNDSITTKPSRLADVAIVFSKQSQVVVNNIKIIRLCFCFFGSNMSELHELVRSVQLAHSVRPLHVLSERQSRLPLPVPPGLQHGRVWTQPLRGRPGLSHPRLSPPGRPHHGMPERQRRMRRQQHGRLP